MHFNEKFFLEKMSKGASDVQQVVDRGQITTLATSVAAPPSSRKGEMQLTPPSSS